MGRIFAFNAVPIAMPFFTTAEFSTGNVPGNPIHTGQILVFGSAPYAYAHRQNAFVFEFNCTCVSMPITASNVVSGVTSIVSAPSSSASITRDDDDDDDDDIVITRPRPARAPPRPPNPSTRPRAPHHPRAARRHRAHRTDTTATDADDDGAHGDARHRADMFRRDRDRRARALPPTRRAHCRRRLRFSLASVRTCV